MPWRGDQDPHPSFSSSLSEWGMNTSLPSLSTCNPTEIAPPCDLRVPLIGIASISSAVTVTTMRRPFLSISSAEAIAPRSPPPTLPQPERRILRQLHIATLVLTHPSSLILYPLSGPELRHRHPNLDIMAQYRAKHPRLEEFNLRLGGVVITASMQRGCIVQRVAHRLRQVGRRLLALRAVIEAHIAPRLETMRPEGIRAHLGHFL